MKQIKKWEKNITG